jgi:hypothetical protein
VKIPKWFAALAVCPLLACGSSSADTHVGVASCAGSNCHGAVTPYAGMPIPQDEYLVWQRKDPHASAYSSLRTARAQSIAAALGAGEAVAAPRCLVCHAAAAPAARRSVDSKLEDGVGCEACHGDAANWLGSHSAGFKTLEQRTAAGLYPTWDTAARARLCSGCHTGDAEHPVSHALMRAGHPPLLFELETDLTLETPHWKADAGYEKRKGAIDPVRNWAAGQAAGARAVLQAIADARGSDPLFPELATLDCNACHHGRDAGRAPVQAVGAAPIGTPRLAGAHVQMLQHWLDVADASLAARWARDWAQLQDTARQQGLSAARPQALQMLAQLDNSILPAASVHSLSRDQSRMLLKAILADARSSRAGDFSNAQQTAMAAAVLTWAIAGGEPLAAQRAAIDGLYQQVKDNDRFEPARYAAAAGRVAAAAGVSAAP